MPHVPVLLKEAVEYLDPKPGGNFIDATAGEGGHAAAILRKIRPGGRIMAVDLNEKSLKKLEKLGDGAVLVHDNFGNLGAAAAKYGFGSVNGILFDLGMSSAELEESGRGFSFLRDEPLDMRYDAERQLLTAKDIVNDFGQTDLENILRNYGEERYSRRIAGKIVEARKKKPIGTTFNLAGIVKEAVPGGYERGRISPATRTFQALRIAVNDELGNLQKALAQVPDILAPDGRVVVISFHSLEDRIVKNFFREKAKEGVLRILTKKPITPDIEEIRMNPRSRSAKMRAAAKH